jgi:hypothetical protein
MVRIHFDVVVVNIWQVNGDGIYESFVIGGDGVWTLTISPLSDILLVGMINLHVFERTSWTRRNRLGRSVLTVEGPVIVHDIN